MTQLKRRNLLGLVALALCLPLNACKLIHPDKAPKDDFVTGPFPEDFSGQATGDFSNSFSEDWPVSSVKVFWSEKQGSLDCVAHEVGQSAGLYYQTWAQVQINGEIVSVAFQNTQGRTGCWMVELRP